MNKIFAHAMILIAVVAGTVRLSLADDGSHDHWGAIAYSTSTGKYGWAGGRHSQEAAESAALKHCPTRDATIVVCSKARFFALAKARNSTAYGWASGKDREDTESRAREHCRERTRHSISIAVSFSNP